MSVPFRYEAVVSELSSLDVSFDVGGLRLFPISALEDAQVGYSKTADGRSLVTRESGSWRANWMVIGQETCCGDPIFVDTEDARNPVFSAMHGEGSWNAQRIAISMEAFAACFEEFATIAKMRGSPVAVNQHPIEDIERAAFLSRIEQLNQGLIPLDFLGPDDCILIDRRHAFFILAPATHPTKRLEPQSDREESGIRWPWAEVLSV